ncbi:collagenase-like [Drosophila albomicans]|uniref:Collagenase-like n=1 Tax=Drosophila albomicans TaxID=7291 RepID=A0A9C6T478_DROAB|nr:collagenase-like [Drosophila albomicans]
MKVLIVFALTLAYVSLVSTASVLQDQAENVGIINGHDASPGQFPYQVKVMADKGQRANCGGSLIDHNWVLTAASCIAESDHVAVFLGSVNSSSAPVLRIVSKKDIIEFKDFNDSIPSADISLLRIKHVEYNKNIQPVKLPKIQSHYQTYAGSEAIITGWGDTFNASNPKPKILQYGKVEIINNTDCRALYGEVISSGLICASSVSDVAPWNGDAGGPLVQLPSLVQVGITSFYAPDNQLGYPAIFTRVTSLLEWIKHHTGLSL